MKIIVYDDNDNIVHKFYDNVHQLVRREPDHVCDGIINMGNDGMALVIKDQCNQINPFLCCNKGKKVQCLFFVE